MTPVTLDRATHTYRVGGILYPSVSDIVRSSGLTAGYQYVDEDVSRRAREWGDAVHKMTAYNDQGTLKSYDPQLEADLMGWQSVSSEWRETCVEAHVEESILCKRWGFCGTPDRVYIFLNPRGKRIAIVPDIKTSDGPDAPIRLQTALYAIAVAEVYSVTEVRRVVVRLNGTVQPKVTLYDNDAVDRQYAIAEVQRYNWIKTHGGK